jgi:NADPH:quinone reductase-like Zn-dependent oxidoreductase
MFIPRNRANHESGAFAELTIAKASVQRKKPEDMSFEEAASLGVALMTVVCLRFGNLYCKDRG